MQHRAGWVGHDRRCPRIAGLAAGLLALTLAGPAAAPAATGVCGKHRGAVVSAADPLLQGRVQVVVPGVVDTPVWAVAAVPFGRVTVPRPGDTVWVEFERCDTDFPIWAGTPDVRCRSLRGEQPRNCRAGD
jgi:hypothetical protein